MSGQSRRRNPVLVHAAEPLRHSHDGSVLRLQFLEMALGALNDEDRLREVRGVDDGELSAGGRGHKDENEGSDNCTSHHWGLRLRLSTEPLSRSA
jgi:hypothetical protein